MDSTPLWGGEGNDELKGGTGVDKLRGGDGDDVLYAQHVDLLVEGNAGNDVIHYDDNLMVVFWGREFEIEDKSNDETWLRSRRYFQQLWLRNSR